MIFNNGREMPIDLYDISTGGVGFELPSGSTGISVRQVVRLKCAWNPRLLDQGRFVIRSIQGRRVGVESVDKKFS